MTLLLIKLLSLILVKYDLNRFIKDNLIIFFLHNCCVLNICQISTSFINGPRYPDIQTYIYGVNSDTDVHVDSGRYRLNETVKYLTRPLFHQELSLLRPCPHFSTFMFSTHRESVWAHEVTSSSCLPQYFWLHLPSENDSCYGQEPSIANM